MIARTIRKGMIWKVVVLTILLHVVIDAGGTLLTWHQAVGAEKWPAITWTSYETLALYVKLITGVCTTIITLKDTSWQKAQEEVDMVNEEEASPSEPKPEKPA